MTDSDTLPTITADRLHLRWLTSRDIPDLFAVFSDLEVTRYWSSPPMKELSEAAALLEQIHQFHRERSLFQWGLALRSDDRVIGTCTLAQLDPKNRRAEIGYALNREQWGRGLMKEGLEALLDHAFTELALNRIEADVDPRNIVSIALLERLGFRREGYLRERWQIGGETQDSVLLGLLVCDWRTTALPHGQSAREQRRSRSTNRSSRSS